MIVTFAVGRLWQTEMYCMYRVYYYECKPRWHLIYKLELGALVQSSITRPIGALGEGWGWCDPYVNNAIPVNNAKCAKMSLPFRRANPTAWFDGD